MSSQRPHGAHLRPVAHHIPSPGPLQKLQWVFSQPLVFPLVQSILHTTEELILQSTFSSKHVFKAPRWVPKAWAHNSLLQLVKALPASGSNLPPHHNCTSLAIWNPLQAHNYYLNLQTYQKFLLNSILF